MILTQDGDRKLTPQEEELICYGAYSLVRYLEANGTNSLLGIPPFDEMEWDEKLVALRVLLLRAGTDEVHEEREMWLEATLMAVITELQAETEAIFKWAEEAEKKGNRSEIREARGCVNSIRRLIASAYLSHHWDSESVLDERPSDRSHLDKVFLRMRQGKVKTPRLSAKDLDSILDGFTETLFYDWDFLQTHFLDLKPEVYQKVIEQTRIAPTYLLQTAPSCRPAAVEEARRYFFVK